MFKDLFRLEQFKETSYLTGLRAYAALAVLFIHSGGAGLREIDPGVPFLTYLFGALVDFGKYGVLVFFVLSAYTISMSLDRHDTKYWKYLVHRFLRVIPMYYLAILVAFYLGGIPDYFQQFNVSNTWQNLVSHLSFMNLFQVEYRNNLLAVEWSVPIELFYYFLFPPVFLILKRYTGAAAYLYMIALCIIYLGPLYLNFDHTEYRNIAYYWSVTKYAFCFAFGMALYHFQKNFKDRIPQFSGWMLLQLFVLLICFISSKRSYAEEFITLWTGALILAAQGRSLLSRWIFENKVIVLLGTVSYSFYLIHYPVLMYVQELHLETFFTFWLTLVITAFLSVITYLLVERPFMNLGRKYF